jgi:hypothetical protein
MHTDFQHQNQDSRQSPGEQLMAQFDRQAEMERRIEQEEAAPGARFVRPDDAVAADLVLPENLGGMATQLNSTVLRATSTLGQETGG